MSIQHLVRFALPLTLLIAAPACEDPAQDKPKATVSSAAPVASAAPVTSAVTTAKAVSTSMPADALAIDAAASSIGFVGSKVTGKHEGKFEKFSGSLTLAGEKAEGGSVKIEIDLASVKTDDPKLDGHLKAPDFFDVAQFPKATFTSSAIKAGGDKGATHTLTGELDLHGKKQTITFPATIAVAADGVTATSEFSINRKDFGIMYEGMKDNVIRDDVLIKLSIKAPRKK